MRSVSFQAQQQEDIHIFRLVDTHIHLDKYASEERITLLEQAFTGGVEAVVAVSMNMDSCEQTRALAHRYPQRVLPAYGYHPEQPLLEQAAEVRLFNWIEQRHKAGEAFAIGEVGLPYYKRTEAQRKGEAFDAAPYLLLLEKFVKLAAKTARPIVLHAVYEDAHEACDLLEQYDIRKAHFHWFKGDETVIGRMEKSKFMVSITPDVLYEDEIEQLVRRYPIELMMTETDGPWPFEGPFAATLTHPLMMRESVRKIAELKQMDARETALILLNNAKHFYEHQVKRIHSKWSLQLALCRVEGFFSLKRLESTRQMNDRQK